MNRPKVIAWLLEHREYWDLPSIELVRLMQGEKLISRKTNAIDVKTYKLISEAKIACGEAKPPVYYGDHKHWHDCTDCGKNYDCYTPQCPYPKEARCEGCFRGERTAGAKECLFEEQPLHCASCGVLIGELGTCADAAFCAQCEKTFNGRRRSKRDVIYVPTSGSDSRRISSKVR